MRVFSMDAHHVQESGELPQCMPASGFVWMAFSRREFELLQQLVHAFVHEQLGIGLHELHVQDLLNNQLPSHYDYTADYDLLVFRRLALGRTETDVARPGELLPQENRQEATRILRKIDTSPVAFLVMDRLVISVHPADCAVHKHFASRLLSAAQLPSIQAVHRVPANPADLMLRMVSHVVDAYLDLRREMTRELDHWQAQLLDPRTRFNDWSALLNARMTLHHLDDICEDQRSAVHEWHAALASWPVSGIYTEQSLEMLKVRSRDVLEHIERVVHHVERLEKSAETAVQMHFNAQSNRTNEVMRTLTVLTAIFLPLNLVTGFFGMNFENFPALHTENGLWLTELFMLAVGLSLAWLFWRKRYLSA